MNNFLYDVLLTIPLATILLSAVRLYLLSDVNEIVMYIGTILISFFVVGVKHVRTKWKIVMLSGLVLTGLSVWFILKEEERTEILINNIWIWPTILCILAGLLLTSLITRFIKFSYVWALITFGYLIAEMIMRNNLCRFEFVMAMLVIIFIIIGLIQRKWTKSGYTDRKEHILFSAPFILLLLLLILGNFPKNPYSWKAVTKLGEDVYGKCVAVSQRLFSGKGNGPFGKYGDFNAEGGLGGTIGSNDRLEIEFNVDRNAPQTVYFTGRVFDTFDGQKWSFANSGFDDERAIDTLETMYSVYMSGVNQSSDIMRISEGNVRYEYMLSDYVASPSKLLCIKGENMSLTRKGNEILSKRSLGYGSSYYVEYLVMNSGNVIYEDFVESEHPEDEESFNGYVKSVPFADLKSFDYDDLQDYRQHVYQTYLPQIEISDECRHILDEVTGGSESDYEKLKRIEQFLKQNKYTLSPAEYPKSIDSPKAFLDYYLTEDSAGYCAYFATAFVIMARAEGIPARYMEGYASTVDASGVVQMKEANSHAWPEAYIEGVGWLRFEPTSGLAVSDKQEYWDVAGSGGTLEGKDYESLYKRNSIDDYTDKEFEEAEEEKKSVNVKLIIIPIGGILAILILTFITDRIIVSQKYKRMDVPARVKYTTHRILKTLKHLGFEYGRNETLGEYSKRIGKVYSSKQCAFIEIYERTLYSGREACEEELAECRECLAYFMGEVKAQRGFFIWILVKFVL